MKTVFITGASAGIGAKTAELFLCRGWKVYAGARRIDKMRNLAEKGAVTMRLDLADEKSMQQATAAVMSAEKKLDVLVNNAGFGAHGMFEDVPLELARQEFEVNVFGLARMCQLILPGMRANRSGRIINMSSIAGRTAMPTGSWYHASKHAVEAITECLRMETGQFGIKVSMIEPGPVGGTEWDDTALVNLKKYSLHGPYSAMTARIINKFRGSYRKRALKPETVAETIYRAATEANPPLRYPLPFKTSLSLAARRLVPDCIQDFVYRILFNPTAEEIAAAETEAKTEKDRI